MIALMIARFKRAAREQTGSFTLEASLSIPVLLIAVIALISFSLMLYNRSELYATAAAAVDRTAYAWDNSSKDLLTGAYSLGQSDGLYWRLGSDSLSDAFRFLVPNEDTQLPLPAGDTDSSADSLPRSKLRRAGVELPRSIVGSLRYTNRLYDRVVQASVERQARVPKLVDSWFIPSTSVELKSSVTDPVELLRTVDLVRTFSGRLKELFSRRDSAMPLPESPSVHRPEMQFTSEKEAAAFLRSLLGSPSAVYVTTPSGQQRKLDSLDPDGLFHEAKFGYTSKNEAVENQIAKDLELLRSAGQVKGVVWHFFRDSRNGKVGPSKPLRKELEKRGIIVVIHG